MKNRYEASAYDTRIDAFRKREHLKVEIWAKHSRMSRQQLQRYRAGQDVPRADTLANLMRAASELLHRHVDASELYDLGEAEPVGNVRIALTRKRRRAHTPSTPFAHFLYRHDIAASLLAEAAHVSVETIRTFEAGTVTPAISTIAQLVRTLRKGGYEVVAADIVDLA